MAKKSNESNDELKNDEVNWDPRIVKVIFVGKASSGKTNAYADFPKPMIVQDTDHKIHTIKYLRRGSVSLKKLNDYSEFDPENLKDIQYIPVSSRNFEAYFRDTKAIIANPPMGPNGPGTWVLDSLYSIADNTINYALSMRGGGGKSLGIIPIPDLPEWMGESMYLSSLFTDAKDLPCHVILTAHMVITEREIIASKADRAKGAPGGTTLRITKQLLTGGNKVAAKIPIYFDEVWNFQSVPSIDYGKPPSRVVFTATTDECDLTRTKLPLPYTFDITYNPTNPGPTLWDYVSKAIGEAIDALKEK